MPVTGEQVATLRALLKDDIELHRQLLARLNNTEARKGYTALIAAAFAEAVQRHFGKDYSQGDVIDFVAKVRSQTESLARKIDPEAGERLINAVLGDGSTQGMSREAKTTAQFLLLVALIADQHLDDAGLNAFLTDARKLADQILGG